MKKFLTKMLIALVLLLDRIPFYHKMSERHKDKKRNAINDWLCQLGFENVLIFDCPSFDESIIGVTKDGRLVYVYDEMAIEFARDCHKDYDYVDEEKQWEYLEEAFEFIDYNTIRTVPYMGMRAPIIVSWNYEEEKLVTMTGNEYEDFYFNEDTCYILRNTGEYYTKEEEK